MERSRINRRTLGGGGTSLLWTALLFRTELTVAVVAAARAATAADVATMEHRSLGRDVHGMDGQRDPVCLVLGVQPPAFSHDATFRGVNGGGSEDSGGY